MKWFDEFLSDGAFSLTDKTDKSNLKNFRTPKDKTLEAKTGTLPTDKTDKTISVELQESMRRLKSAGVTVAVWDDGAMRVLVTKDDSAQVIDSHGSIYSPQDLYAYVTLNETERRMLHSFKKRFGGTTEWK